jgi:hypothetical protein
MAERCFEPKVLLEPGLSAPLGLPSWGLADFPEPDTSLRNWSLFIFDKLNNDAPLKPQHSSLLLSVAKEGKSASTRDDAKVPLILDQPHLHLTRPPTCDCRHRVWLHIICSSSVVASRILQPTVPRNCDQASKIGRRVRCDPPPAF